jgi:ketosteroid isomerase-like protein
MSRHIETVQAIYAAFGRGDVPAILAHLSPDVEWEHDGVDHGVPYLRPRRGRETIGGFFADLGANVEITRFEPLAFLAGGDQVAVPIRFECRLRRNGRAVKDLEMHLWTFGADGRVARFRHVLDTHQHAAS